MFSGLMELFSGTLVMSPLSALYHSLAVLGRFCPYFYGLALGWDFRNLVQVVIFLDAGSAVMVQIVVE